MSEAHVESRGGELAQAWVNFGLAEGAERVLEDIRRQGYVGVSPFVAAEYDPTRAAVIEGRKQLAEYVLLALKKSFEKCQEPVPGAVREKLLIQ